MYNRTTNWDQRHVLYFFVLLLFHTFVKHTTSKKVIRLDPQLGYLLDRREQELGSFQFLLRCKLLNLQVICFFYVQVNENERRYHHDERIGYGQRICYDEEIGYEIHYDYECGFDCDEEIGYDCNSGCEKIFFFYSTILKVSFIVYFFFYLQHSLQLLPI